LPGTAPAEQKGRVSYKKGMGRKTKKNRGKDRRLEIVPGRGGLFTRSIAEVVGKIDFRKGMTKTLARV